MSIILAIDPGPAQSAYVLYDGSGSGAIEFGKVPNGDLMAGFALVGLQHRCYTMVIEQVASMGMAVGEDVFETVFWTGRFCEAWMWLGCKWHRTKRHEVKSHLCGNQRAKDANIRQALIDKFGPGKEKAIGTKKQPGPLYGISGDCWQALALAVTFHETQENRKAS